MRNGNQGKGSYWTDKNWAAKQLTHALCSGVRGDAASKFACVHANGGETRNLRPNNSSGSLKPRHSFHLEATTGDRQLPKLGAVEAKAPKPCLSP